MTWRRDVESRADRLERATTSDDALDLFDGETQELVRVSRALRPALSQSETRRAATKAAALAAFEAAHAQTPAVEQPREDTLPMTSATSLLHPSLGRLIASDVEPISAERAQEIAERLEKLVGEAAQHPNFPR